MEYPSTLRAFFTVFLLITPISVLAQNLKPLEELIVQGSEETYPLVRCSGLYLSGLEWAGETRMGQEHSQNVKMTVVQIAKLATEMRSGTLGAGAEDSVYRDIRLISDLYLKRYETNYASTGQAFGNDPLWASDTAVCKLLFESTQ
ncbi:hypothetical protein [Profundibacter sp.]